MDPAFLAAMVALGLASGVHCAGMCGGIVTAFSLGNRTENPDRSPISARLVLFNAGRISSYAVAGALAGTLGWYAGGPQTALLVAANGVLLFVGLHLAGLRGPMRWLESLGAVLWRRIQPFAARLMKQRGLPASFATGLAWGWLPCGLVYGALTAAAFAGSPTGGAAAMLAFGVGTLPWLLAAGVLAARLRGWLRLPLIRLGVGGTVIAFGAWGLAHAGTTYLCS